MDMQSSSYKIKKYPALEVAGGFLTAVAVSQWICNPVVIKLKNIRRWKSPGIF
jgi:hypothetical protein